MILRDRLLRSPLRANTKNTADGSVYTCESPGHQFPVLVLPLRLVSSLMFCIVIIPYFPHPRRITSSELVTREEGKSQRRWTKAKRQASKATQNRSLVCYFPAHLQLLE